MVTRAQEQYSTKYAAAHVIYPSYKWYQALQVESTIVCPMLPIKFCCLRQSPSLRGVICDWRTGGSVMIYTSSSKDVPTFDRGVLPDLKPLWSSAIISARISRTCYPQHQFSVQQPDRQKDTYLRHSLIINVDELLGRRVHLQRAEKAQRRLHTLAVILEQLLALAHLLHEELLVTLRIRRQILLVDLLDEGAYLVPPGAGRRLRLELRLLRRALRILLQRFPELNIISALIVEVEGVRDHAGQNR